MDESLKEMTMAYSLDPLRDPMMLGLVLLRSGRLREAQEQFRKSMESEPTRAAALWMVGHVDVLQGRFEEGLAAIRKALTVSGNSAVILAGLGWGNAVAGNRGEAMKALEELRERSSREHIQPYLSARIYSALGEHDLAFEWLEKAHEERDPPLTPILSDESLKGLHEDRRFGELLKKMNLDPESLARWT
jgi:tetratricopeptide (TPR) repeat protein